MNLPVGQRLALLDAQQRRLGQLTLERSEGELLFCRFERGAHFSAVEGLFRRFEEAVDQQALAVVDEIDAALADLRLRLELPDGSQGPAVRDVQIWNAGGMTCRLDARPPTKSNGREEGRAAFEPARG